MPPLTCKSPSVERGRNVSLEGARSDFFKASPEGSISSFRSTTIKHDFGTPLRVPVDSNGQRLCPTPKSTHTKSEGNSRSYSSSSPRDQKLRYQKGSSFQPLETIQSPAAVNDQAKRVLVNSNGHWVQDTPTQSKQATTSTKNAASSGTNCNTMTPRALFNDSQVTTSHRISGVVLKLATESLSLDAHDHIDSGLGSNQLMSPATRFRGEGQGGTKCDLATDILTRVTNRKRAREENEDQIRADCIASFTRSKTEADRIALFLKSPARRVSVDELKQDNRGTSELPSKQSSVKKIRCATPKNTCTKEEPDSSTTNLERDPQQEIAKRLWTINSPAIRVRVSSPGRKSLLRSPLVTSTKKGSD